VDGRAATIDRLTGSLDDGSFLADLARRVAIPTESQVPRRHAELHRYLDDELRSTLEPLGFEVAVHDNPVPTAGPLLVGRRIEDRSQPTVLLYGHADVVRGMEGSWSDGRGPWTLAVDGDRVYGRGVADNKGQHSVNLAALAAVIAERGRLGWNAIVLVETGEEVGSPGLHQFVAAHAEVLAADVLIASDGPRLTAARPTLFLGARGALDLVLEVRLREGAHHSGNWGGLLANPAVVLAHAVASIIGRDGRISVRDIVPSEVPASVRAALEDCPIEPEPGSPTVDVGWGEPGLTPAERLVAWSTFEVLALGSGDPEHPVGAIPPSAVAQCQIRYPVDLDPGGLVPALRRHLDRAGFPEVDVRERGTGAPWAATRLDPDDPWVRWVAGSIERSTGRRPAIMPNLGGSLPNDAFAHVLGLPTVWVPHSYAGCRQHAPDEHALVALLREGLAMMGGIFWDLGESPPSRSARSGEAAG
jgi:acetylornithine deacetylase/succinyl-diaminopimelate desuccinylase-like protein